MFVCSGNICRSPIAHAVVEERIRSAGLQKSISLESSGTTSYHLGDDVDRRARAELARHGIRFRHRARLFRPADLDEYDLILTMDRGNYRSVLRLADERQREKVRMFRTYDPEGGEDAEVPDPYYGATDGFGRVYEIIDRSADALVRALSGSKVGSHERS